ncbi:hypothetical protein RO3G_05420 [Rhizopus delemar RA 99-880]|uniref:Uncharacterized protein n=1 Tax=Rhizopus delemar (strain RA 99-880 / ATCC MYA-4621 / FGSC 9543 / NRRL 43880) TaxID=246409 RepID=I1BWY5_RHIO9|nr:hypothetical protein RO3G_05420 [Rhizopus delemar RA 99-880]|eukprot:EIE80715.1 hypothetical protein RO3G_05420 [Rhizopus delemar RA 99-880]
MIAKYADKHAQIENMLNHSVPWDVIQSKVGCGKSMIRRISRKTKMQSKNSTGRHRLLTPREETNAAGDIRLSLSKSAADASFGVKKPDRSVNPKTITRTFKRKGLKSGSNGAEYAWKEEMHLIETITTRRNMLMEQAGLCFGVA